jgi:hypothetical protein
LRRAALTCARTWPPTSLTRDSATPAARQGGSAAPGAVSADAGTLAAQQRRHARARTLTPPGALTTGGSAAYACGAAPRYARCANCRARVRSRLSVARAQLIVRAHAPRPACDIRSPPGAPASAADESSAADEQAWEGGGAGGFERRAMTPGYRSDAHTFVPLSRWDSLGDGLATETDGNEAAHHRRCTGDDGAGTAAAVARAQTERVAPT